MSPSLLVAVGLDDDVRAAVPDGCAPARVTRVDRGRLTLIAEEGARHADAPPGPPAVAGDWVALDPAGAVRALLPRRTLLRRRAPGDRGGVQLLAANVDVVLAVRPLDTSASPRRVLQLLELAWDAGAEPAVALTKADLHPAPLEAAAELEASTPGVPVLALSVTDGTGLDALRALLAGRTTALVGESGAGKSTLVNALLGADAVATGATRRDGQGRHTTTWRELLPLPGGGALVDTPGLRVVQAVEAGDAYADVAELAAACRFADCRHDGEPGCAVEEALATGELDPTRLAEARRAERLERFEALRDDPLARRAERLRWRALQREARSRTRQR